MAGVEFGAPQIVSGQATCTGAADLLVAARTQRREVVLFNHSGGADAYIGATGVTTSTGLLIPQGSAITLNTTAAVYGTTASGTATFSFMEVYQ